MTVCMCIHVYTTFDVWDGMVKDCLFEEIAFGLTSEWVEEIIHEKIWEGRVSGKGNIMYKGFKVGTAWNAQGISEMAMCLQ